MARKILLVTLVILIGMTALYFRSAGIFRGMEKYYEFHPDVGKQVIALRNFLNGNYHWETGNRFEEGYPYALNHLDEMAMRSVAGITAMSDHHRYRFFNDWWVLHHTMKVLRVLYGMLCLFLIYRVSAFLFTHRASRIAALFLFAITPVAIDVSHFATGDIGVDLFSGLVLLTLVQYARTEHLRWLLLSSFFVGVAFACKYNGLFTGLAIFLYFILVQTVNRSLKRTVAGLLSVAAGFVCGVLAATPAFFIVGGEHLADMLTSMQFIREYGVPEELLHEPYLRRVWIVLISNIPRIGGGFGMSVLACALIGTSIAGFRAYTLFAEKKEYLLDIDTLENRRILLCFSIFMYPFLALGLSLLVKYAVMPFHFSYLAIPFVLAAVYLLDTLLGAGRWMGRLAALAFFVLLTVELGAQTLQDSFFWQRLDNAYIYYSMPEKLENRRIHWKKRGERDVLKQIALEPENSSFFRNRFTTVSITGGALWQKVQMAPVPQVPYPDESEWIFVNGPVLPLNDRMFHIPGGRFSKTEQKQLVFYDRPGTLFIGVRSGAFPAEVKVEAGEAEKNVALGSWDQKIVEIEPEEWRRVDGGELNHDIYFVPLVVTIPGDEAWVTVLTTEREVDRYRLFGGQLDSYPDGILPEADVGELARLVNTVNYYSSDQEHIVAAAAGNPSAILSFKEAGLAAGAYLLLPRVQVFTDSLVLSFQFRDKYSGEMVGKRVKRVVKKGTRRIKVPLEKPFRPYGCEIVVTAQSGSGRIMEWQLRPHTGKIVSDLRRWKKTGVKPSWLTGQSPALGKRVAVYPDD